MKQEIGKAMSRSGLMKLVDNGDGTFSLWILSSNYDGHCRGGIRQSWRYVYNRESREKCEKAFKSRHAAYLKTERRP